MLKSNGELDPAQAISYPLPLKILLLSLNGFISASFERLEINVDEDPSPQSLSKVNFVVIFAPELVKKFGLKTLIFFIISIKVFEILIDEDLSNSKFSLYILD